MAKRKDTEFGRDSGTGPVEPYLRQVDREFLPAAEQLRESYALDASRDDENLETVVIPRSVEDKQAGSSGFGA